MCDWLTSKGRRQWPDLSRSREVRAGSGGTGGCGAQKGLG